MRSAIAVLLLLLWLGLVQCALESNETACKPFFFSHNRHRSASIHHAGDSAQLRCRLEIDPDADMEECRQYYSIVWYKDGQQIDFDKEGGPGLHLRLSHNDRRLCIDRVLLHHAGNYTCRINSTVFYPSDCQQQQQQQDLSCYRADSLSFMPLMVEPEAPAQLQSLHIPQRPRNRIRSRTYLSQRVVSPSQTVVAAPGRQPAPAFHLQLVQYRKLPPPAVQWRRLEYGSEQFIGNSSLYSVAVVEYSCTRADTGRLRNGGQSCYNATLRAKEVSADTVGEYAATAGKGAGEIRLSEFRLSASPQLPSAVVKFNKNSSVCEGDTFELDCSVRPRANIVILSLGDQRNLSAGSVVGVHRPKEVAVGNISVRVENSLIGEWRASVRLERISAGQAGLYACVARPIGKYVFGASEFMQLTVATHCYDRGLPAAAAPYVGVGVGTMAASVLLLSVSICVVFAVRRRNAPIVKRLRLVRHEHNELYHRHREASDAPLLVETGVAIPEIVVERIAGSRRPSGAEATEVNKEVRYVIPSCPVLEVDRKKVSFCKQIGQGAFGSVHSGQIHCTGRTRDVAIKRLKHDYSEEELVALVKEMEIMRMMNKNPHPNIVKLVGVCTKSGPFLLLVELAHHGNLRDFLRDRLPSELTPAPYNNLQPDTQQVAVMPTVSQVQLLRFCEHVASALDFMASISIVHRDIAARNILVDGCESGDGLVAKVADFGLTRNTQDKDYYRVINEGKLPVKWLAPECLHSRVFSTKSDVWAYGILLYEVFTFGEVPYPGVSPGSVHQHLQDGNLNAWPKHATAALYAVMLDCWAMEPAMRPTFGSLVTRVSNLRRLAEWK